MSPDKAQQLGNDLSCLAASIAEIAEELKAMYDFDYENAPDPEPPIDQLIRRLIEKIRVYEDKFTVEFKSGLTVDVNE